MKFNINQEVRVRLTDSGRAAHRREYGRLRPPYEYQPPKEDGNGWSTWKLHALMTEFGGDVFSNDFLPFDSEVEILGIALDKYNSSDVVRKDDTFHRGVIYNVSSENIDFGGRSEKMLYHNSDGYSDTIKSPSRNFGMCNHLRKQREGGVF